MTLELKEVILHFQKDRADGVTATTTRKSLHHNPLIRKSAFIKIYLQQWFLLIQFHSHFSAPPYKHHVNWGREEGIHEAIKHDREENFYNKFKYFWEKRVWEGERDKAVPDHWPGLI